MKNKLFWNEAPLLRLAIFLMAGITIGKYIVVTFPLWPILLGLVLIACLLGRYELLQSVAISACMLVLGWLLMNRQLVSQKVTWPEEEVRYEAVVLSEPIEKPKTMLVDIQLVVSGQKLKCYLYKDERSKALRIGDGLQIQSRIEQQEFTVRTFVPSWKWKKAQVSLKHLSRLDRTKLYFLKLRSRLLARIKVGWNDDNDAYAVVAAMALGDKKGLTKELKETYSVTGASHILALSGLHLSIIYTVLSLLIGRRRQMFAQIVMITGIWVFVFLVGMPTSVVRSAVMLTLYAVLSLGHRDKMSVNTLAFTAIVMMIVSPMTLFDVGFQMSYMAVFTILLFVPLFEEVFPEQYLMSHSVVKWVWGIVAVSLAAQIGTAPLTAYYFGRFSTCFLLTNLIVMPAAVVILILTMVVMLIPSLAYLLLYIVAKLNAILSWIASIPGSSINGLHPSVLQISMVYVIIIASYLLIFFLKSLAGTKKSRTFAT